MYWSILLLFLISCHSISGHESSKYVNCYSNGTSFITSSHPTGHHFKVYDGPCDPDPCHVHNRCVLMETQLVRNCEKRHQHHPPHYYLRLDRYKTQEISECNLCDTCHHDSKTFCLDKT